MSSASDKTKLFSEHFSKNSNLDDSGISLLAFPYRTNLKLHNVSVTPKLFKKVIMNLDMSKVSGPDCNPVVVLRNCKPKRSYKLTELFNSVHLSLSFWFYQRSLYLRMLEERSTAKIITLLLCFLWLVRSLKNL